MRTLLLTAVLSLFSVSAMAIGVGEDDAARAEWRDYLEYANDAWAGRDRAILKVDDAVYLDDGQQAWLQRHTDERVHYLWTTEEPTEYVVAIAYADETATLSYREAASMATPNLAPDNEVRLNLTAFMETNESFPLDDGVQMTAYPTQMRPGETGLRATVFNPNHPDAANFEGLRYYDYNSELVFEARFEALDEFEPTVFQTSRGWYKQFYTVGHAVFELNGEEIRMPLYGYSENPSEVSGLSAFFTDAESGHETYGVGRYLNVEVEEGRFPTDTVTIDFNYAYNPNCARSSYYNCPYAEFDIAHRVPAGEMIPLETDH